MPTPKVCEKCGTKYNPQTTNECPGCEVGTVKL